MANEYASTANLKTMLGISDTTDDTWLGVVATAASRAIDTYCERRFYADANASARYYHASDAYTVEVDDISATTNLAVATDDADDGLYATTWAAADYELYPLNGVVRNRSGWPYTSIRAIESRTFPRNRRSAVKVTAKWGWTTTPEEITQAAYILGAELFKRKDAPFGVAGVGELGVIRIREDARLMSLLAPFRKVQGVAG